METLEIYTDGGCSGNPGLGAWAYVVQAGSKLIQKGSAGDPLTTNNKMELTAVIRALEFVASSYAPPQPAVIIHTDSQYVKQGITSWIHNWKRNGWKTAAKKPVKNKELWIALDAARQGLNVEWKWVPGHAGVELNELCDSMVNAEMDILKGVASADAQMPADANGAPAEKATPVNANGAPAKPMTPNKPHNTVYIATSLDGYIADKDGGLDWLHAVPNPEGSDFGFADFMKNIDAILMGRKTFESVCALVQSGEAWPYTKPVFVYSSTLSKGAVLELTRKLDGAGNTDANIAVIAGTPQEVVHTLQAQGYYRLYIDGGKTIQSFLDDGLIDELIITTMPLLLGGGTPLFGELQCPQQFQLVQSEVLLKQMVRSRYVRKG